MESIYRKLGYFFFFTAPLSVSTIAFGALNQLIIVLVASICFLLLVTGKKIVIDKYIKSVSFLFYLPMFISSIAAILFFTFSSDIYYLDYFQEDFITRIINVFLCFIILLSFNSFINTSSPDILKNFLLTYGLGVIILLGFFAIWQILNIYLGVWIIELPTRSHLHSLESVEDLIPIQRVTSLADEPSYLVPFLLDAAIIFAYYKKYLNVSILIIILFFSISLAGYFNLLLVLLLGFLFFMKKIRFRYIVLLCVLVLGLGITFESTINTVLSRKELSEGFDYTQSSRTSMIVLPWKFLMEEGSLPLLLGNGPASMKYLKRTQTLPSGYAFHTTSNNIFTDIAYEGGMYSFVCLLIFFGFLFHYVSLKKNNKNRREIIFGYLLIFNLIITLFYRADYVSSRFIAILLLINIFSHLNSKKNDFCNNTDLFPQGISY